MQVIRRSTYNVTVLNKQFIRSAITSAYSHEETPLKSWREIPGPSTLPVIGPMLHFLPGGVLHNISEPTSSVLYKKYGAIVRLGGFLGIKTTIFIFDAESASHILRSENQAPIGHSFDSLDYYRKVYNANKDDPDAPTGLATDQGETWKKFRSTVNPIMLKPQTVKLNAFTLKEVAGDMIKRMRMVRNDKNMIQAFDTEMNLWALESIGVVALGRRLNCFDPNLPEDSPARKLIKVVHDIFKILEDLDMKPNLWRYITTPSFKRAMQRYEEHVALSKYFIDKAVEELKTTKKKPDTEKSILEKLLEIDERVALLIATDLLLAGVDTAANTITMTLYLLAVNPEKQEKLRTELKSTSQQDTRPYLKACLKESMRLMSIVMGTMRTTTKEYSVMGYKIPKDMQVVFGHQVLSLMEEHFPRPNEFIPERWITDKSDPLYYGHAHPFAYSPFGFGVRTCIGRRIANLEMETFLAELIENFQIEWFGPPMKTKFLTINYPVAPFNFIFKDLK